jgi:hypothetical protein
MLTAFLWLAQIAFDLSLATEVQYRQYMCERLFYGSQGALKKHLRLCIALVNKEVLRYVLNCNMLVVFPISRVTICSQSRSSPFLLESENVAPEVLSHLLSPASYPEHIRLRH